MKSFTKHELLLHEQEQSRRARTESLKWLGLGEEESYIYSVALYSRWVATTGTFSPGWWLQPGLKSPPAKAYGASRWAKDFSPDWWLQLGLMLPLVPDPTLAETNSKTEGLFVNIVLQLE